MIDLESPRDEKVLRLRKRVVVFTAALFLIGVVWLVSYSRHRSANDAPSAAQPATPAVSARKDDPAPTLLYAHNLLLRKGPDFRIYVRWIRGQMLRTHATVNPSFDDADSFVLYIEKGVVHANIGDISNYLNAVMPKDAPLQNVSILPQDNHLKLHGTLHKGVPLPVELIGDLSALPDGRVQFTVNKINVLKIPMKGLLGGFHIQLSDLVHQSNTPGIEISGNTLLFDTQKLLPPPHIRGRLTSIRVQPPDLEVIYGGAPNDETKLAEWHNFLRLRGGTLDFGKLTMHDVDLTMIDGSDDPWFDLDLVHYQDQLVNGYTRMTAQKGLEIYMPDLDGHPLKKASPSITLGWLKNRKTALPPDIPH
jgi:hypothetical protein